MASIAYIRYQFRQFIEAIERTRAETMQRAAFDVIALAKDRVINTGMNAQGKPFSPYTESYKRFRQNFGGGRQVEFKNFSLTGDMMKDIAPIVESDQKYQTVIRIGAKTEFSQNKLTWQSNAERQPILDLTQDEIALLEKLNRERFQKLAERYGL